jgi:membrane fusion protein
LLGHYTRRETVAGQLVPSAGLLNVVAPDAGTITRLNVRDGQRVRKGEVLLRLSSEQDSAALGDTHALVGRQLEIQRARLQADLVNQQQLGEQQGDALRSRMALLQGQLTQIAGQLAIQQQEAAVLNAQAQYKTLLRQQLDARQQYDEAQQQLARLPLDEAGKRNDTERQLAALAQSTAQNEMQRAVVLRAPRDGVVSTVLLKEGQMVAAGQPLLSILPAGSSLQAQLLVPSRAIGFIEPGSRVVLRYQAFPYQKFGQQYGRVSDISRSALGVAEVNALIGQQAREPLYRIEVKLDSQQVMAYGRPEPVKPGMALEADVLMERRRLIEWVFEPLYGLAHHLTGSVPHG